MDEHVATGAELWVTLCPTFVDVLDANAESPNDRIKIWAGFISAMTGAAAADLGIDGVHAVIEGALKGADAIVLKNTPKH